MDLNLKIERDKNCYFLVLHVKLNDHSVLKHSEFIVTNQNQPYIEFKNVSFSYGKRPLLNDINLSIKHGQIVAIMGGSGSGKTTLLRLISGQVRAQKGQVLVNGQDIGKMNQRELYRFRRNMGMLFQFGALFTDYSVIDNVSFPLKEHTNLPAELIHDLALLKLHAVGLLGTENMMPSELSGGMARRIALARTMALDPALILYDEPFTGLDPISLGVIAHLIKRLNNSLHNTAVMVTHDILKSLEIVDYVYFIANGTIVAEGTPPEIKQSDSAWLKQFVNGEPDGPVHFAFTTTETLGSALKLESNYV